MKFQLRTVHFRGHKAARIGSRKRRHGLFEQLEPRTLLSAASLAQVTASPFATGSDFTGPYVPAQIAQAYAFDNSGLANIKFSNGALGDGAGQTIAIVAAYDNPNIVNDLAVFDARFGLPAPPSFKKVNQKGGTAAMPATDSGWAFEIALDVQWAHAMAPDANILLVEANSNRITDLMAAVDTARRATGVTVVTMSWGANEFPTEATYDKYFTTPANHPGVSFVAATGDSGSPGTWPAFSPNVLAIGGTSLTTDSLGNYVSETGWSGSGGGSSRYERQPKFQSIIQTTGLFTRTARRTIPDVAYNSDPNTGYLVYNSVPYAGQTGWWTVGGTSAAAPQWAALLAIANQGRVSAGLKPLANAPADLYSIYSTVATRGSFHDITSGSNGFLAGIGYDPVTGLGTPYANLLVKALVGAAYVSATPATVTQTVIRSLGSLLTGRQADVLQNLFVSTPTSSTSGPTPLTDIGVVPIDPSLAAIGVGNITPARFAATDAVMTAWTQVPSPLSFDRSGGGRPPQYPETEEQSPATRAAGVGVSPPSVAPEAAVRARGNEPVSRTF